MPVHSPSVQLFVTLAVKPQAWDGYLAAMQAEAAGARSEPGNLAFDLLVDPAAPHTMHLLEHWASQAALEQEHARQPYYIHVRGLEATALAGEFEERHLLALDPPQPYPAGIKSRAAARTQVLILQGGDAAALALLDAAFAQAAPQLRAARGNHTALLFANADRAGERLLVQSWDTDTARHAAWSTGAARALARVIEATPWSRRQMLALVDRASA